MMSKKMFYIFTAFLLCLACAACSGSGDGGIIFSDILSSSYPSETESADTDAERSNSGSQKSHSGTASSSSRHPAGNSGSSGTGADGKKTVSNYVSGSYSAGNNSIYSEAAGKKYQYNQLTDKQKRAYNLISGAIDSLKNNIQLYSVGISPDDAMQTFRYYLADNPQCFWVSRSISFSFDRITGYIESITVFYTDGTKKDILSTANHSVVATADRALIAKQRAAVTAKLEGWMKKVSVGKDVFEKEKIIHDIVVQQVDYDSFTASNLEYVDQDSYRFSIYSAAVEGVSVCEGYSKLFQALCHMAGINCTQVSGTVDETPHMWNTVQLDGEWYHVDTTWDDLAFRQPGYEDMILYEYFNLSDDEVLSARSINRQDCSVPACNGRKYNYCKNYFLNVTSADGLPADFSSAVTNMKRFGEKYFVIVFSPSIDINKYINGCDHIINEKLASYGISAETGFIVGSRYYYYRVSY